jgi:hypothetical protein
MGVNYLLLCDFGNQNTKSVVASEHEDIRSAWKCALKNELILARVTFDTINETWKYETKIYFSLHKGVWIGRVRHLGLT